MLARARTCAWTSEASASGAVSYSRLLLAEEEGGVGRLDIGTGAFTAGRAGAYQVVESLEFS